MQLVFALLCIFLFNVNLYAKSTDDICYSIQIGSFNNSSPSLIKQQLLKEKGCLIIPKKENGYTIKCECGLEQEVRKKLPYYKKIVPGAFLTKVRKETFTKEESKKSNSEKSSIDKPKTLNKKSKNKESLNELIYKVFIYNNDLKNAQKIAKNELKQNPNNLAWRKRLADALSWSGKQKEALKHYMFIYEQNKQKKLENSFSQIYGSYDTYFNLLNDIYINPNDTKKIDQFLKVSLKLGITKNAIAYLDKVYQKTKNPNILKKCAQYYYKLGESDNALKYLKILEKKRLLDIKSAIIMSRIYFEQKDFSSSLQALIDVKHLAKNRDSEYWYLLSDLYSYVKQDNKSAEILKKYCLKNSCRKQDYDKLISFYATKDKEYVSKISLKTWKQFKDSAYFFAFAKSNLQNKKTKIVIKQLNKLSVNERKNYEKEPLYWLILASIYEESNNIKKAILSYEKALFLDPSSNEILSQYGWFLMKHDQPDKLKEVITKIEKRSQNDQNLYILAAAINYKLNRIKKSYLYYKKALRINPDNIDLKLDFANLLMIMGKKEESLKVKKEVYSTLQNKLRENSNILKNKNFLLAYLRASIYFIPAENYMMLMKYAKKVLDKKTYLDIKISWKLYTGSDEYVKYLSRKLKNPELWLKIHLALKNNDTLKMRELLYHYGSILPKEAKINALIQTKQISKAKKEIFEALDETPENKSLYKTKYDIDTQYSNKISLEAGYENQQTFEHPYIKIKNTHHISNSYYIKSTLHYAKNISDEFQLTDKESNDISALFGLKKLSKNGYFEIGGGFIENHSSNFQYFFNLYNNITKNLSVNIALHKNKYADETTQLRIEGEKDQANFGFKYQFNSRLAFKTQISSSKYRLHTGESLGNGGKYHIEAQQKIKFGYPDILFTEYLSIANFSNDNFKELLPKDYLQGGVGLHIGKSAIQHYNTKWRPYADLSAAYHNLFGIVFGGQLGISGKFFGTDRLNLSINYNRSATDDNALWLLKLTHSYLY